jgi:hypothetical protein
MLSYLTHLGDARLLLPASVVLFLWLRHKGDHKAAAAWMIALASCLALTVAAKLLFYKCGWRVSGYRMSSPSGHVSLGITFFGCCLLLAASRARLWLSLALMGIALSAMGLLGYSRIALDKHTLPEVLIGCAIGLGCVALFASLRFRATLPSHRVATALALGLAAGGTLLVLWQSSAEPIIRAMAFSHNLSTGVCGVVPLAR